jgi:hypothetical protein
VQNRALRNGGDSRRCSTDAIQSEHQCHVRA